MILTFVFGLLRPVGAVFPKLGNPLVQALKPYGKRGFVGRRGIARSWFPVAAVRCVVGHALDTRSPRPARKGNAPPPSKAGGTILTGSAQVKVIAAPR